MQVKGCRELLKCEFPYAEGNDWTAVLVIQLHRHKLIDNKVSKTFMYKDPIRFD